MIDRSKLESAFKFVTVAAERSRQLQRGALPRVPNRGRKATTIAQVEVAEGLVRPVDEADEPDKKG